MATTTTIPPMKAVRMRSYGGLPLAEARRAHEMSQTGHVRGKIAVTIKD